MSVEGYPIVKGHTKLSILEDHENYIYNPFYIKLSILVHELLHLTFFVLKLHIKSESVITQFPIWINSPFAIIYAEKAWFQILKYKI